MEDRALASMWLPSSPPGVCKQCALGERVCLQIRNHLEMGQPPQVPLAPSRTAPPPLPSPPLPADSPPTPLRLPAPLCRPAG